MSNKQHTPHPLVMARQGAVSAVQDDGDGDDDETGSSITGLVAVREEERNEEDERTEVEREDGTIFTIQNSVFLNPNQAKIFDNESEDGVEGSNLEDIDDGVPKNLNVVASPLVDLQNESLGSRSTSSSTRRRNEELERENEELRRRLQEVLQDPQATPEDIEESNNVSPPLSLGSTSTSSSTCRRIEELQQQLDKALHQLDISNQRLEWLELNPALRNVVEEQLRRREGQNQEGLPIAYAFDVDEVGPATKDPRAPHVSQGTAVVVTEKKAWWKSWWVVGGVLILVVVTGGVLYYYAGAFSVGATAAGEAAATGGVEAVLTSAATVMGTLVSMRSPRDEKRKEVVAARVAS